MAKLQELTSKTPNVPKQLMRRNIRLKQFQKAIVRQGRRQELHFHRRTGGVKED